MKIDCAFCSGRYKALKSTELISALLGRAGVNDERILRSFEKKIAEDAARADFKCVCLMCFMTQRELWEMIGKGEGMGDGGKGGLWGKM